MELINNLDVRITRWSCGTVRSIEIAARDRRHETDGEPFVVSATQYAYGQGFLIQTNFSDFYETRLTAEIAFGVALKLACAIDADGLKPSVDADED